MAIWCPFLFYLSLCSHLSMCPWLIQMPKLATSYIWNNIQRNETTKREFLLTLEMGWGKKKATAKSTNESDCFCYGFTRNTWIPNHSCGVFLADNQVLHVCSSSDSYFKLLLHCFEFREGSSIKTLAQEVQLPLQISFLHLLICRTAGNIFKPCLCCVETQLTVEQLAFTPSTFSCSVQDRQHNRLSGS